MKKAEVITGDHRCRTHRDRSAGRGAGITRSQLFAEHRDTFDLPIDFRRSFLGLEPVSYIKERLQGDNKSFRHSKDTDLAVPVFNLRFFFARWVCELCQRTPSHCPPQHASHIVCSLFPISSAAIWRRISLKPSSVLTPLLPLLCPPPPLHRFVNAVAGPGGKRRMNPNGEK